MWYFSPSNQIFNKDHSIWPDGLPVSDEEYSRIQKDLAKGYELILNPLGYPDTEVPEHPLFEEPIDAIFIRRMTKLNNDYEDIVAVLKSTYPLSEAITWPVQLAESKIVMKWCEDNPGSDISEIPKDEIPFIYEMAKVRSAFGIEGGLKDLAERVIANDALFSPALATVTAVRHAVEKQLQTYKHANDRHNLENYNWDFMAILQQV